MKSYYVTTHPGINEKHEVHEVGCNQLPIERRYIGEFKNGQEALKHVKFTYADAVHCVHCDGKHYTIRYNYPAVDYL